MRHIPDYLLPNFCQCLPAGNWRLIEKSDPRYSGRHEWENLDDGSTLVVPAIWYNLAASVYAVSLRWNADRNEEFARNVETEGKPWSRSQAESQRHQARRLRAIATLCDREPTQPAGHVDFRGLSDPTTSREMEIATIEAIERGG